MTTELFPRQVHIAASPAAVWHEIGSLPAILARLPGGLSHTGDERSATITGRLAWGPLRPRVSARAELLEIVPEHLVAYRIATEAPAVEFTARLELHRLDTAETGLSFSGRLELAGAAARRLRGLLTEVAEEHVHALTEGTRVRAERAHQVVEGLDD